MRDLFDSARPMSLGSMKFGVTLVGLGLFLAAVLFAFNGLGQVFSGRFLSGLTQIVASAALLGACFLTVRLLGELLAAMHRLNDRLAVMTDEIRQPRTPAGRDEA